LDLVNRQFAPPCMCLWALWSTSIRYNIFTLYYTLLVNGELFAGDEKTDNRKEKSVNYMLVCINNAHALKKNCTFIHSPKIPENRSYSHSFLDLFTEGKWKNLSKSSRVFVSGTG
jgi:hypothetical protein